MIWINVIILLLFLTSFISGSVQILDRLNENLLVEPSGIELRASNIRFEGKNCYPSNITDEVYLDSRGLNASSEIIRLGPESFFESHRFYQHSRGDGLALENFPARTCKIYRMFGIAEAAGQFERKGYTPDATRGLFRVGDKLWMGSNGIGIAVLNLATRTWSRYDVKPNAVPGDHLAINYADKDYVFVTTREFPSVSFHIYSVKKAKWLRIKAVSTKLFREYGYTTGRVSVSVDHRVFAKQTHLPIDSTFTGLRVKDNGSSYLFEKDFSESRTVFGIKKSELERAFKRR